MRCKKRGFKKWFRSGLTSAFLLTGLLGLVAPSTSLAAGMHDLFELEGNATKESISDWNNITGAIATTDDGTGSAILLDSMSNDTIFNGGGSKDHTDITSWKWRAGSPPDKDEIMHAFAAAYMDYNFDVIINFGADKYSNDGSAHIGFWFFQDDVKPMANGSFSGEHKPGDMLILTEFSGGGTVAEVKAFRWNTGFPDNLEPVGEGHIRCDSTQNQMICGTTNNAPVASPWDYMGKDGVPNMFDQQTFFEGAINITQALGLQSGQTPCFTSFLAETRSSYKTDAVLKDFIHGSFGMCSIKAGKTCAVQRLATTADGYSVEQITEKPFLVQYNITATNNGAGMVPAGTTIDWVDTPIEGGEDQDPIINSMVLGVDMYPMDTVAVATGEYLSSENGPMNKAAITASFPNNGPILKDDMTDVGEGPVTCSPATLSQNLAIEKTCDADLAAKDGKVVVEVSFDSTVCNTGDVPMDVTLSDPTADLDVGPVTLDVAVNCSQDANICGDASACKTIGSASICTNLPGTIFGGEVCHSVSSTYDPDTAPTDAAYTFSNTIHASGEATFDDTKKAYSSATAHCPLCMNEDAK